MKAPVKYHELSVIILIITALNGLILTGQPATAITPYDSGYSHGCSDAKLGGHPYLDTPGKGPSFHTATFMQGYNDGYSACSGGTSGGSTSGGGTSPAASGTVSVKCRNVAVALATLNIAVSLSDKASLDGSLNEGTIAPDLQSERNLLLDLTQQVRHSCPGFSNILQGLTFG